MAEIESAEAFARRKLGVHQARLEQATRIIEARDNAVRLAAKRELLGEIQARVTFLKTQGFEVSAYPYAFEEAQTKYSPASTEPPTNVPTPTLPRPPK